MQTLWLLIAFMFFCLSGCGSRGDLYLPDSTTPQTSKMVKAQPARDKQQPEKTTSKQN